MPVEVCNPDTLHGGILLRGAACCFDLSQTLDCGQAFRWQQLPDGSFRGVAHGKVLRISRHGEDILLAGTGDEACHQLWQRYFDIARDYSALKARFGSDPVLREAVGYAPGIRLLRQQPWETLCTFIISANNNIPRIKGIVERLCTLLGDPLEDGLYAFPSPQRLAALEPAALEPLRSGYRAPYLLDAARRVATGALPLDALEQLPTPAVREALLTVKGVGPKVADCVLLFGYGRLECFPADTWIKKVMATLYPQGFPACFAAEAGIAQQYLFHYARHHGELFL